MIALHDNYLVGHEIAGQVGASLHTVHLSTVPCNTSYYRRSYCTRIVSTEDPQRSAQYDIVRCVKGRSKLALFGPK